MTCRKMDQPWGFQFLRIFSRLIFPTNLASKETLRNRRLAIDTLFIETESKPDGPHNFLPRFDFTTSTVGLTNLGLPELSAITVSQNLHPLFGIGKDVIPLHGNSNSNSHLVSSDPSGRSKSFDLPSGRSLQEIQMRATAVNNDP